MNWGDLTEYLQAEGAKRRCDLYLRKRMPVSDALKAGKDITQGIVSVFEDLVPLYDVIVGAEAG
jgi:hypothetical protein